jgi:glycosyltransferase involved in cell wall biosynthesis
MLAPAITILTPTLNAEQWLAECIRSIKDQTVGASTIQHLILDGGSTDGTVRIGRASGIDVDVSRDGSLYEALNRGISLARGDVIGWLNADDTFAPDAIERVLGRFAALDDAEVVFGHYELASDRGVKIVRTNGDALDRVRSGARRTTWITPLATFFRAATLRSLGPYLSSYRISADLDMWLRMAAREPPIRTAHTGTIVGTFRMHENSLSSSPRLVGPLIEETLRIARSWSEDPSPPPGVRRHALYLARLNALRLVRTRSRGAGALARLSAVIPAYGAIVKEGPGALWDVRGEAYALAAEVARSIMPGNRRRG